MPRDKQAARHRDDSDEVEDRRPQQSQRRRRQAFESESDSDSDDARPAQRRRASPSDDAADPDAFLLDMAEDSQATFIKKLVRYVLSCEYARLPIRRDGIKEKVFGKHSGRNFKPVFESAQNLLRERFGMMMEELPLKEKVSLRDRRAAAQRGQNATKGSSSYVLVSILRKDMRGPEIVAPSLAPTTKDEASYVGLYTFIIACISLSGGTLSNEKLLRNLRRLNAEENTPLDTTENLLAKMQRQGYVVKIRDSTGQDEAVNWMVGPRGKIEVGDHGVRGLVKEVYGASAPEDLKVRLAVSLGTRQMVEDEDEVMQGAEQEVEEVAPRRGGRNRG